VKRHRARATTMADPQETSHDLTSVPCGTSRGTRTPPRAFAVDTPAASSTMGTRGWSTAIAALFVLIAAPANAAEAPNLPVQSVQVEIRIGGDGAARVQERYRFTRAVTVGFRYLTGPCSDVVPGSISVKGPAGPIDYARARTGPWVLLTPPTALDGSPEYWVSYNVPSWTRTTNIPVVLPSHVLEAPPGAAMSIVDIQVIFPGGDAGGTVLLPQMQPDTRAGTWSTRMLALPSFVRVRFGSGSRPDECPGPGAGSESGGSSSTPGSSGSLEWSVLGFVVSLVAWVVFYMRWANARQGPSNGAHNS